MSTSSDFTNLAERVISRCRKLASFSEDAGGTRRTFLSPPMRDCHREVSSWMQSLGMNVSVDAVGNLRGVYPATSFGAPRLFNWIRIWTRYRMPVHSTGYWESCSRSRWWNLCGDRSCRLESRPSVFRKKRACGLESRSSEAERWSDEWMRNCSGARMQMDFLFAERFRILG